MKSPKVGTLSQHLLNPRPPTKLGTPYVFQGPNRLVGTSHTFYIPVGTMSQLWDFSFVEASLIDAIGFGLQHIVDVFLSLPGSEWPNWHCW